MTRDSADEAGLVRARSSALSRVSSTSLAQRGEQDFAIAERAELCFCEGFEHDGRGEFEKAIVCYMRGLGMDPFHVKIRLGLAYIFLSSWLHLCDYKEAVKHLSVAAEHGNDDAQSLLAGMYRDGEGVAQNDQRAFFWQEKAAMQGHPCDQRLLGLMYEHGVGVEQDPDKALFWYQKAADQGGYFERSQITELQKRVIGHEGGWCKRRFPAGSLSSSSVT
jgi:tetratricopeptide (TPR) repeat protein